jgi:hypothetical protein
VTERPLTWVHATLLGGKTDAKFEELASTVESGNQNEGSCVDTSTDINMNTMESNMNR